MKIAPLSALGSAVAAKSLRTLAAAVLELVLSDFAVTVGIDHLKVDDKDRSGSRYTKI
jgi:hypothetical protein